MPRLFFSSRLSVAAVVRLTGEEARYVSSVLRMGVGDELTLIDPAGTLHRARIVEQERGSVRVQVVDSRDPAPAPASRVTLLQGLLKGQKMDLVVQKTTELGIGSIIPLVTARSQVRGTRKLERWRRIAREASRQCGRADIPHIDEPVGIKEFFSSAGAPLHGYVFWEEGGADLEGESVHSAHVALYAAVGPEGGLTEAEVHLAEGSGLKRTTLGPLVLRAETAAISTVAILQFLYGRQEK
jgi:16S rRNA (uracil1498-N3)-methyltransferase